MILYAVWMSLHDTCLLSEDELALMWLWAGLSQIEFVGRDVPRSFLQFCHQCLSMISQKDWEMFQHVTAWWYTGILLIIQHFLSTPVTTKHRTPPRIERSFFLFDIPIFRRSKSRFSEASLNPCHVRLHVPQLTLTRVKWRCRKHFEAAKVCLELLSLLSERQILVQWQCPRLCAEFDYNSNK